MSQLVVYGSFASNEPACDSRKDELARPYFRDMNQLVADPTGKLFAAQSFVKAVRMERFPLWETSLHVDGKAEEKKIEVKDSALLVCYQLGVYASPYANEWKNAVLERWPHMSDRIIGIEVRERKNLGYIILRAVTQGGVRRKWSEGLTGDNGDLLVWQETRKTRFEGNELRKSLDLSNKFIPFVFAVNSQGLVTFKAVGKPLPTELDLLEPSIVKT